MLRRKRGESAWSESHGGSGRPKGLELLLMLGATEGPQASLKERVRLRAVACVPELGAGNRSFKPCSSDQSWCFLSQSQGLESSEPWKASGARGGSWHCPGPSAAGPNASAPAASLPFLPPTEPSSVVSHLQHLKARCLILALDLGCPGFAQSIC